jgi:antitoxin component of MazEF toxin-antitoxin module
MPTTTTHRQASILKWGNSQGVRLTADLLRKAQLEVADPVRIYFEKGRIVIEAEKPKVNLSQLLAQIPEGGALDLVDYGPSVGRELP